jgi:hypothetical protein
MPKLAKYKSTRLNALDHLLRDAHKHTRPPIVDTDWLKMRGVPTNGETIISVLKFVGLIRPDNTPTDLWDAIRDPTPANKIKFADAVRTAYSDVFAQYERADREDDRTLLAVFETQVQATLPVRRAVLKTFKTLVKYGDFDVIPESLTDKKIALPDFVRSVENLETELHQVLSAHEEISVRMTTVHPFHEQLKEMSLQRNILLNDSLLAVEAGLFRAGHVLAWGGFIDFLCEQFSVDSVKREYPKWQVESIDDLHWVKEDQLIEAGKKLGLYRQNVAKTLHGLLNDRNQLAHGSGYFPDLAETVGSFNKLFRVIKEVQNNRRSSLTTDWPIEI